MKPRPPRPLAEVIGRNVWDARIALGLHQGQLAELAGVGSASICRIELGARLPSLPTLVALADALGVAPGLLLKGTSQLG